MSGPEWWRCWISSGNFWGEIQFGQGGEMRGYADEENRRAVDDDQEEYQREGMAEDGGGGEIVTRSIILWGFHNHRLSPH